MLWPQLEKEHARQKCEYKVPKVRVCLYALGRARNQVWPKQTEQSQELLRAEVREAGVGKE